MKENSLTGRYSNEEQLILERKDAISSLLDFYSRLGVINNGHLGGDIINCFAYAGTAENLLRPNGGRLTSVELDEECVNVGIRLGNMIPFTDDIVSGTDASEYLALYEGCF